MRRARGVLVLALASCGDNDIDPRRPHSGSRLRLIEWVYPGGAREIEPYPVHDTLLDLDCSPAMFSVGARFCMPELAGGVTHFVDAGCTRSVGAVPTGTPPPPTFIRYFTVGTRTLPSRVYRAGAAIESPAQVWEQLDQECFGPRPAEPADYYALGEELPLVRIRETERIPDASGRVALGIDTSDDGMRMPATFYDLALDVRCDPEPAPHADSAQCVPRELSQADYFSDAQCSAPVAVSPDGSVVTARDPSSGCVSLGDVGTRVDGQLFESIDGTCVPVPAPANAYHVTVQSPVVQLQRIPNATSQVELIHGDLQLLDRRMFDRALGDECTRDGDVCIPEATITARTVFFDAACSTPSQVAFEPTGACRPPVRFVADTDGIHRIGEPITQPLYELEPGDRCGTYAPPPLHVVRALGPLLPGDSFLRGLRADE